MSVKRFDMGNACGGEYRCGMEEFPDGEYVLFKDFETAEDKLEKIRGILEEKKRYYSKIWWTKQEQQILAILKEQK